jgi:glycine cleavage system T protein
MAELLRSPLADQHLAQGAVLGEYHGALVPARFSDPAGEHRAVRASVGLFDFSFRTLLALHGANRAKFLHRIVSNDIQSLQPGQGTYATLLNTQGHILADFRVYCAEDSLLINTDADLRDKTMQGLRRYIIGERLEVAPLELFAVSIQGKQSRALLAQALQLEVPALDEYANFAAQFGDFPLRVARASSTGEEGYEVWASAEGMAAVWAASRRLAPNPAPCGFEALESLRIEAGIPRYGPDLGEDTLPLEADLFAALSFNKGCYVGQEIVERARSRGHVNWKLVGLLVEAPAPPAAGEALSAQAKAVGEVTSACVSPTLGKTIALAYVRREAAPPGTQLQLASGAAATVTALPFYPPPSSFPCG